MPPGSHILFPFTNGRSSLEFALQKAKEHHAILHILCAYRLTELKKYNGQLRKHSLDQLMAGDFEDKYGELLRSSKVEYTVQFEVGFLSDRVMVNLQEQRMDAIVLDTAYDEDLISETLSSHNISIIQVPKNT